GDTEMTVLPRSKETKIYLALATTLVLVVGYWDLARGGTTLSAVLLAIAYCALIPAVIWMTRGPDTAAAKPADTPYVAAGVVALGVLVLYLATMAPSTAMWDTSEYITAAYTFGLPHPPGNPFFVI